jgi:SEC-C motif
MKYQKFLGQYPAMGMKEALFMKKVKIGEVRYEDVGFFSAYCMNKNCDCRRAVVQLLDIKDQKGCIAAISYGWEPLSFYRKLKPDWEDEQILKIMGPCIEENFVQTNPHPDAVELFRFILDNDPVYARSFAQQYARYKLKIGMKLPKDIVVNLGLMQACNCQSGKTFKMCCAPRNRL